MSFRLNAKSFFLTYPKCNLEFNEIYDVLSTKGRISYALISKELHADGTPHRHVYVQYSKTLNLKSPNCFDIKEHHGNYQTAKNSEATKNYVKKDKDFQEYKDDNGEHLLDKCKSMTETEFFEHCAKEKIPIGYYNEAKRLCADYFTITSDEAKGTLTNPNPNLTNSN